MPVTLLERSSGSARAARIGVLHRRHANTATWLTLTGFHLETFLWAALLVLVYLFIPEQVEINWMALAADTLWLEWVGNGFMLLVMAAVAPFYILSGFCLYIGRRIELEGWDIEIQFRNLRHRHLREGKNRQRRAPAATALLLLGALAAAGPPPEARAESADMPQQARETIDEVLAGEDFHQIKEISGWRLKDFDWSQSPFPEWIIAFFKWLEGRNADGEASNLGPWVGLVAEVLLWLAIVGLVAWILWRHRETILRSLDWRKKAPQERAAPETLFGLDVRRETLPQDVCTEVLRLWQSGDRRGGLGLLYRATLSHLIEGYRFDFGDHLTESECAQLVRQRQREPAEQPPVSAALNGLMQQLTLCWQQLAYAHRAPQTEHVQTLCDQWREAFEDGR